MKLQDLHNYRHGHRLNTSSAQSNPQAHLIFANAARKGIYSPSVVAARRKQRELKKRRKEMAAGLKERSSSRLKGTANGAGNNTRSAGLEENCKQTKEQLAMAVRKHFNAMSVNEGEVVARFTYVVRQVAGSSDGDQDKGFRMRFQP
jgi:Sin3 binding region of histone deacetylase complex subunit SAP30